MKLGIISDTHDFLDPQVEKLFAGVDRILHAGDVGKAWIIFQLEQIAPVTAVLGNNDTFLSLKETETLPFAGRKFLLHHIVNPHSPADTIAARIKRAKPDVVVFGHTHKPFNQTLGGILFFNPGYAGKSKFGAERSLAILHCDEKGIRPEFLAL